LHDITTFASAVYWDMRNELLRRGIGVELLCSRLDVPSPDELRSLPGKDEG